jgi:LacI family transcriptional regulator
MSDCCADQALPQAKCKSREIKYFSLANSPSWHIFLKQFTSRKQQDLQMSISEIARRAGVSMATVSRVLNDTANVAASTRRQVESAVQELNYVVPSVRRGPKPGTPRKAKVAERTRQLAVVGIGRTADWLQLPVMSAALGGVSRAASSLGMRVILDDMIDINKPSNSMLGRDVDGVLAFVSGDLKPAQYRELLARTQQRVPLVCAMGGESGLTEFDRVIPDDRAIAKMAFDYLIHHGRRNLAYIGMPRYAMLRDRGLGFAAAAHDGHCKWTSYLQCADPREAELFGSSVVVESDLESLVDRLVAATPRIDGLFISHDLMTTTVHPMLLRRGVDLEKDLLLVSCNNEEPLLRGLMPRPVSINICSAEVGVAAVRRLCFKIEHPGEAPVTIKIPPAMPVEAAGDPHGM